MCCWPGLKPAIGRSKPSPPTWTNVSAHTCPIRQPVRDRDAVSHPAACLTHCTFAHSFSLTCSGPESGMPRLSSSLGITMHERTQMGLCPLSAYYTAMDVAAGPVA